MSWRNMAFKEKKGYILLEFYYFIDQISINQVFSLFTEAEQERVYQIVRRASVLSVKDKNDYLKIIKKKII